MDEKSVKDIASVSFALDSSGTPFLDYMLEQMQTTTIKGKPYYSLDENGRRRVFRSAVLEWSEMREGFAQWKERQAKKLLVAASPPASCPICRNPLERPPEHPGGYCRTCGTEMRFVQSEGKWKPFYPDP